MNKIKILALSTSGFAKKEGISTVILDYFSRFNPEEFITEIVIDGNYDKNLISEFKNCSIVTQFLPSRKKNTCKYLSAIYMLLKRNKYDALYIHGSSALMSMELFIARLCGCKVRIAHSHNTTCDNRHWDRLLRPLFYHLYTDAIACGIQAGKWLYGNRPFDLMKNGRDINKYTYDAAKRKNIRNSLHIDEGTLVVGHVGNFNKQKNQEFLLRVFCELLKKRSNSKLYLMGNGTLLDEQKNLAKKLSIENDVVFTGNINNVEEMLQAMDVMVLPSLYEGLPLVAIEWQIASLPCIISDYVTSECAFSELVCFKSLQDSPDNWADAIIELEGIDRYGIKNIMEKLTISNGFDINQNALSLQEYFRERCRR